MHMEKCVYVKLAAMAYVLNTMRERYYTFRESPVVDVDIQPVRVIDPTISFSSKVDTIP